MKSLYGIDEVLFIHFSHAMMEMPWEEFVDDCLLCDLNVVHVICGADFRFGYRGEGTAELLREACAARHIGCDIIAEIGVDGVPVHSTLVRDLLRRGEIEEAAWFRGHPHCLSRPVVSGKRLGRTMGIPTANIAVPPEVLVLPAGVFAARVAFGGRDYAAVTNVGTCPTISDHAPLVVEPWILDFNGDLYGREIRVFSTKSCGMRSNFPISRLYRRRSAATPTRRGPILQNKKTAPDTEHRVRRWFSGQAAHRCAGIFSSVAQGADRADLRRHGPALRGAAGERHAFA